VVRLSIKDPIREKQLFFDRALIMFVVVVVLFGLLVLRMVQLQVWEHQVYQTRSDQNRIQIQPLAPSRGLIFDRHGELLADNRVSSSVALVTERIDNLASTIEQVSRLVRVTPADITSFEKRILRKRRPFEPVALRLALDEEEIAVLAVNRHRLVGVEVTTELIRYYPYGALLSHARRWIGAQSYRVRFTKTRPSDLQCNSFCRQTWY